MDWPQEIRVDRADPITMVVGDPLTEVTRRVRRALSMISLLALAGLFGARPSHFDAFGFQFPGPTVDLLIRFLWLSLIYFLVTFSVYAYHDFLSWRSGLIGKLRELASQNPMTAREAVSLAIDEVLDPPRRTLLTLRADDDQIVNNARLLLDRQISLHRFLWRVSWTATVRLTVDFFLPPTLAVLAVLIAVATQLIRSVVWLSTQWLSS